MFILLLLSLELQISPNPIEGGTGEKIPFTVTIMNEEGKLFTGETKFDVVPYDLGQVVGGVFIPKREGRGVLRCRATVDGKTIAGYTYIRITGGKRAKIVPDIVVIEPGEKIQFRVLNGKPLKWKIIPEEIGYINDGQFTAKKPGRGRVVAILDNKNIVSAFIRVKGSLKTLEIVPKFIKIKTGEKIQFFIKEGGEVIWRIEPEDIGVIDKNGLFHAKIPGRGIITAETEEGGVEKLGRAIVIVSGKLKVRIIPEKTTLHPGEMVRFQVKIGTTEVGERDIPVRWKVIPNQCGFIRRDGTFFAGKNPITGRVVAIVPQRFGGGIASARISIVPGKFKDLIVTPRFKELNLGEEYTFRTLQTIPVHWEVVPADLGIVNQYGTFTPKRNGSGIIIAKPLENINIKPGKALIVIGANPNIHLYLPDEIIEGFSIRIKVKTILNEGYKVFWYLSPQDAGKISPNGIFYTNRLTGGKQNQPVTIFAIFYRERQIIGWGSVRTTIRKR